MTTFQVYAFAFVERLFVVVLLGLALHHRAIVPAVAAWSILMAASVGYSLFNEWRETTTRRNSREAKEEERDGGPLRLAPPPMSSAEWTEMVTRERARDRLRAVALLAPKFGELSAECMVAELVAAGWTVVPPGPVIVPVERA